jgi:hypothetical protein
MATGQLILLSVELSYLLFSFPVQVGIVDLLSAWRSGQAALQHRSNPTRFFSEAEDALKRRDVIEDGSTKSKKNCRARFCCGFAATLLSDGDRALQAVLPRYQVTVLSGKAESQVFTDSLPTLLSE